jgi:hypothetical protein
MAIKSVKFDDLDGSMLETGDGGTVSFTFQGQDYELELSRRNEAKLAELLAPYIAVARAIGAGEQRPQKNVEVPAAGRRGYEPRDVREWLVASGYDIPERGPVKKELLQLFEEANGYAN